MVDSHLHHQRQVADLKKVRGAPHFVVGLVAGELHLIIQQRNQYMEAGGEVVWMIGASRSYQHWLLASFFKELRTHLHALKCQLYKHLQVDDVASCMKELIKTHCHQLYQRIPLVVLEV